MPAPNSQVQVQEIPLLMVGGTKFGRYPKISDEQTWNFIVSDGFLVPYAGYKNVLTLSPNNSGRGLYASYRANIMIAIFGTFVYSIDKSLAATFIGNLSTSTGDVYIAENNGGEIAITDGQYIYVYNYNVQTVPLLLSSVPGSVNQIPFTFQNPGFISFQDGRLIVASNGTTNWVLSDFNNALVWPTTASNVGSLQTKPDFIQAVVPMPGGGQNILVFGRNVTESWQDVGAAKFPYKKNATYDIDYGCLNPSTIASLKDVVVWIAVNEQSGPVLMIANGNSITPISTDGIDSQLAQLTAPENCTGFLYQQDGHLIYQFTFITDNISYAYDFDSKLFFSVSDETLNYHIARQVVFFNNHYYFVSLKGGNLYDFSTSYTNAQYSDIDIKEIPRIRVTPPLRLPDQRYFIMRNMGFTIENGQTNTIRTVKTEIYGNELEISTEDFLRIQTESGLNIACEGDDDPTDFTIAEYPSEAVFLSISRDGAENFGSSIEQPMNHTGNRKSRMIFQRLGQANDATPQFRFVGFGRFVVTNGLCEIYQ